MAADRATPMRRLTTRDHRRSGRRREPRSGADRAHQGGRLGGVADHLGEADREQALEGDHREAPEELHEDQGQQHGRGTEETKAVADDRGHGRDGARDRAGAAGGSDLPHERHDRRRGRPRGDRGRPGAAGRASRSSGTGRARRDRPTAARPVAIARLSTVLPAPRPDSIRASRSAASVASTYQASSGPLSSAR